MKNTQSAKICIRIDSIEDWGSGDLQLLPNETYTLVIDYPFNDGREYKVKTGKGMGLVGLLRHIKKAYDKTYTDANKGNNGYWHGIEDLFIEGITVNHNKKTIRLDVGS